MSSVHTYSPRDYSETMQAATDFPRRHWLTVDDYYRMAKVGILDPEARVELRRAGRAGGMFGAAALGAWLALVLLSFALAWALDDAMPRALAFALVGALWAIVAAVLAMRGKREVALVEPLPETTESLKEDAQWLKTRKN